MVYEKRERVVVDNVPMFLFTGAEWAFVRQHEAEIVAYLKVSDSGEQGSAP
jgi:hypothetical protein